MYYFLAALISAVIGAFPLLLARKLFAAAVQGAVTLLAGWCIFYLVIATTVYPLFGFMGFMTFIWWVIAAIVASTSRDEAPWTWAFPSLAVIAYVLTGIFTSGMFRANDYATMINYLGPIEERVWTQDIQPKDPAHMRMASSENALYQAQKVVGSAGAIGSQFQVGTITLQMVKNELVFVAPLDFAGFSIWLNTQGSPGYIKVSGEDPHRQAELVQFTDGKRMRFTPGAFFGDELERHVRSKGYLGTGLTATTFEIDDEGNPWWVITTFDPTIGWSGEKVLGVLVVNPFTGDVAPYELGKVPEWVDRVIPDEFLTNYFDWQGWYSSGWLNSWWGTHNLTEAEGALLIYGAGDQPEWVVDLTSTGASDDSLVALVYTNSRTGKSVRYKMPGGATTTAVLDAVNKNQDIQFKHLHGAAVQLYNVHGVPTAVVPVLNESYAFQGVAMVSINDIQTVASGRTSQEAFRNYEKFLTETNRKATVEADRNIETIEGVVDIVGTEVTPTQGTVYYLHLIGVPHLFTAGAGHSPELPVTKEGHRVKIEMYASSRDVIPMHQFDNLNIQLSESPVQTKVRVTEEKKQNEKEKEEDTQTLLERLKKMSPEELKKLKDQIPK